MLSQYQFSQLQVLQVRVLSSRDVVVYSCVPDGQAVFEFILSPLGYAWGKSPGGWNELTYECAEQIREVLQGQLKEIPIYFEGQSLESA